MRRNIVKLLSVLVVGAMLAAPARAEMVLYTFDSPQFQVGQRTPLFDRAPNVGLADFRTSFTSAFGNSFVVDLFQPNPLFQGQMLYQPNIPPDILTLVFNMPVTSVQLDFAVVEAGRLLLTSPVGSRSQDSMFVGGDFEGGTFIFSSDTPFTTLQLQAFNRAGTATLFALDNLALDTSGPGAVVPEPSSLALLLVGLVSCGGLLGMRRKGPGPDLQDAPERSGRQVVS